MRWFAATVLFLLSGLAGPAAAWPERPVQIIVPFPAGGTNDIVARAMAQVFAERLGVAVTVLNRDGASGTIGARALAAAREDGHTIGFFPAGVLTAQPQIMRDAGFTAAEFRPICQVFSGGFILAATRNGFADAAGFLAAARASPGGVSVGIGGNYTVPHWALLGMQRAAGIEFNIVAFRGDPGVLNALLSGDLQVGAMSSGAAIAARLPILLATTQERIAELPQVPTARELGMPVVEEQFGGLIASRGVSPEIAARLEAECAHAMGDTRVTGPLRTAGLEVTHRGGAGFATALEADIVAKRNLIAAVGVRVQ